MTPFPGMRRAGAPPSASGSGGDSGSGSAVSVAAEGPALATSRRAFKGFEGLRALAATMVVVHHAASLGGPRRAGVLATPAAVMDSGVAVFFVISGFLIYRPFVVGHFAGKAPMRLRSFLWRRALRLIPAYWLALTVLWALGSFALGPHWWRYYLFLQIYWRESFFGGVIQAWSLCTEVTFYLMVPLWSVALRRLFARSGRRITLGIELAGVGVLWTAAFLTRHLISSADPLWRGISATWLPANLDLFAAGMAMAIVSAWTLHDPRLRAMTDRLARHGGLWWTAALGLFAWYAYRVGPPVFAIGYRGWFWQQRQLVVMFMSVCLLAPVVFGPQDRGLLRRVLNLRPVAWVGLVSYGVYLWHFDSMKRVVGRSAPATGGRSWPGWVSTPAGDTNVLLLLAVGMGLGLLFAALSWGLLERPLQRFKGLADRTGDR